MYLYLCICHVYLYIEIRREALNLRRFDIWYGKVWSKERKG